jgi:transcription elongation factor GreA
MSQEGYDKLVAQLHEWETVDRPAASAAIAEARDKGDLSENAEYDSAKNEQAELEERIHRLETMMRKAKIVQEEDVKGDVVNVGLKVRVKDLDMDFEEEFSIVGATESDPFNGKISNESSVGRALIGHKVGDKVAVEVPDGVINYEVVEIIK